MLKLTKKYIKPLRNNQFFYLHKDSATKLTYKIVDVFETLTLIGFH